jgi:hypothetical protein
MKQLTDFQIVIGIIVLLVIFWIIAIPAIAKGPNR